MFRNILIATDGSAASERAIEHGLALAGSLGATATVVRISGKPAHIVVFGIDLTELPESVRDEITKRIDAHFDWVKQVAAKLGVSCETVRVESEHVWRGLLDTAAERGADIIVMASQGRRGGALRLIGSETMRVLTASGIPVLVVT